MTITWTNGIINNRRENTEIFFKFINFKFLVEESEETINVLNFFEIKSIYIF